MFLNSLNHFRAIAIVIIVAGHCFYTVNASFNTLPERALGNLVTGGTSLFVFISGFLFHYIFYNRYKFKKFMLGKVKKVLMPYTILSLYPIFSLVAQKDSAYDFYDPVGTGFVNVYLIPALKYYFTGGFMTAYWYIPFAMMLFLLSPLHMAFIELRLKKQVFITFLLFVIALFLHRPIDDILVLQSVVYFMPVYLFGIICSEKREFIYDKLEHKEIYLLLFAIALATLQAAFGQFNNSQKMPFDYAGIDIMLIQKVALCLFFMVWLHRFEHIDSKYINILASTSFAVFFLHGFFMAFTNDLLAIFGITITSPWVWYPFVTTGMVLACVVLALAVKKLLPDYSRYIIGY